MNNLNSHFLDLSGEFSTLCQTLSSISFCPITLFYYSTSFFVTPFKFFVVDAPSSRHTPEPSAFFLYSLAGKVSFPMASSSINMMTTPRFILDF